MKDDESYSKGSVFSNECQSTKAPRRRGIGRGQRNAVPSIADSGLGQSGSSNQASLGDSQSLSSRSRQCGEVASQSEKDSRILSDSVFTDADEVTSCADEFTSCTEDEGDDSSLRFSNINCLFFEELQKDSLSVFQYNVSFSRTLSSKDKRLLFLKKIVVEQFGECIFAITDVLYTAVAIAPDKQAIETTLHNQQVTISVKPSVQPLKLENFFNCLLRRVSMLLAKPQAYIPVNLLLNQLRYEVYPGDVLDVDEREHIVRCALTFESTLNHGTVEDIIEECTVYAALLRIASPDVYFGIVERSLHELVVVNSIDKNSYVIKEVLWGERLPSDSPMVRCRRLNSEFTDRLNPRNLRVQGSRRTASTHSALTSGGGDKITSFRGTPATGQQRQLALLRYKENVSQQAPQELLRGWGITLKDTAVVSNDVVLDSDILLLQDSANLATTRGWVDRLSNLKVLAPTRISSWLVVYEKGDERLVNKMVEVLVADAPTIGIEMLQPRKRAVVGDTAEAYEALLSSYLRANPNLELVLVILRSSRIDIYRAVKKWSLIGYSRPILTQIVNRETAKSVCNMLEFSLSIITQINCKLGGALWTIDRTINNTLVIGLSVYASKTGQDVIGFVSTKNKLFTQWYSFAMMNPETELEEQVKIAIRKYSRNNDGIAPDRIIVLSNAIDDESFLAQLQQKVRTVFPGKLTVVYIKDAANYNKSVYELAKANSIAELKELQKSYVFVQNSRSTLEMICCKVIVNDQGLTRKALTTVIRQLKHVYYNVAGEANLPAPVLYAERCAEFVSETLDGQQSSALGETLYYL